MKIFVFYPENYFREFKSAFQFKSTWIILPVSKVIRKREGQQGKKKKFVISWSKKRPSKPPEATSLETK